MSQMDLLSRISHYYHHADEFSKDDGALEDFELFLQKLENGTCRAAEPINEKWQVNPRVKEGILLGFKWGTLKDYSLGNFSFSELHTYPPQTFDFQTRKLRIVPGGNSIRRGAFLADGTIMMPPAFVNVGAYVGPGTMIDSHALVGSCAQIGSNVHLSAGVQIGGVLEPIGQTPVIIGDNVLIGGNCGLFEGVRVGNHAVIAAGTFLTSSTPVYDLINETIIRAQPDFPLSIPDRAVVVSASRPAKGNFAKTHNLHIPAAVIIKYRDDSTDSKTLLESSLRD